MVRRSRQMRRNCVPYRRIDRRATLTTMYEAFYGLNCEPFSVAADPRFVYLSPNHRQARAHFRHGLRRGAGFLLLSGEIGAGKTTVCRLFLRELSETVDVAFVVNPRLDARALLLRVCDDLRIEVPAGSVDLIDLIHGHLLLAHAAGRRTLIVVDEAQALSFDVLEQLRLLTNLDSTGSKLQVFLIGQPELRTMLRAPELEAVAQRVVARFHLSAMTESQTATYIAHRLSVAGLVDAVPFDDGALQTVHRLTGGVPRRINVLCDQTLVAGADAGARQINREMVERVALNAFDDRPPAQAPAAPPVEAGAPVAVLDTLRPRWPRYAATAGVALLLGALLGRDYWAKNSPDVPVAAPPPAAAAAPVAVPAAESPGPPVVRESPAPSPPAPTSAASPMPAALAASAPSPLDSAVLTSHQTNPRMSAPDALFIDGATPDEVTAWQRLARLWGVTLGPGQPCAGAAMMGLRCYRGNGGLASILQLDRPAILKLTDGGRVAYGVLVGLTQRSATFQSGDVQQSIPLADLAGRWHGEFGTLWRSPPGYHPGEPRNDGNAVISWMGQRLAQVDGAAGSGTLPARVSVYQLAHGLQPDGLAGPLTLMQINRDSGIDEPKLRDEH